MASENEEEVDLRSLRRPVSVYDVGKERFGLYHTFGQDFTRRNNINLIEEDKIIYASGGNVVVETLSTHEKDFLLGIDEGGVGAIAVHPSKKLFAVGCKGVQPNIYIYSYPEMKIQKILRNGAERGYSCLAFNKAGDELASVACAPCFMLTIWIWDKEKIFLHAKAFGQEVYNVRFSQYDNRRLTTSGTGHIRFWKMASTFTGQKLQGSIGKFGKVDLSDVSAFVEFPDGKVCSGTEDGALLLWEGNFIKCRFVQKSGMLCHDGEVTVVELNSKLNCLITAGNDGFIRWWPMSTIDTAEVDSDHSMNFELEPLREYRIPSGKSVRALIENDAALNEEKRFYILDGDGQFGSVKFNYDMNPGIPKESPYQVLSSFHGSKITGMSASPKACLVATSAVDGRIVISNFRDRENICSHFCEVSITSIEWVPTHVDPTGQGIVAGCSNGTLKMFKIAPVESAEEEEENKFELVQTSVLKPHTKSINHITFSRSSPIVATASLDGMVFFFECKPSKDWVPLRFVTLSPLEEGKIPTYCTSMSWSGACLLMGCSDGTAKEVDANNIIVESNEEAHTYEASTLPKSISVKVPVIETQASEADEDDENAEADKGPVTTYVPVKVGKCAYSFANSNKEHNQYFLSTFGSTGHQFYKGNLNDDVVGNELALGLYSADGKDALKQPAINCFKYSPDREFLLVGAADGSVVVRPTNHIEVFSHLSCHNSSCGGVTSVCLSFDNKFLLSSGNDGLLVVYRFNPDSFLAAASPLWMDIDAGIYQGQLEKPGSDMKVPEPPHLQRVKSLSALSDFTALDSDEPANDRIRPIANLKSAPNIEDDAYSIQDSKLKSEKDNQMSAAEVKKDKIRQIVAKLRREFDDLRFHNDQLPEVAKLSVGDMCIDGEYFRQLEEEGKKQIEEVKLECEYEAERALALRRKMFARLMSDLMVEEMPLYGFRKTKPPKVKSLRTVGVDKTLQPSLHALHEAIREEQQELSRQRVLDELESMDEQDNLACGGDEKNIDKLVASKNIDKLGVSSHASSLNARREARQLRLEKLRKHELKKPKENEDDTRDVQAILHAEKTVGSYALKCADDYKVPEDQIINAKKKRRQMLMLQESMITLRLRFNERFLQMRKLKQRIVQSMREDNIRICEIDKELRIADSEIFEPFLRSAEFSDDRNLMTKKDILDFKAKRKDTKWENIAPPPVSIFNGDSTQVDFDASTGLYQVCAREVDDPEGVDIREEDLSHETSKFVVDEPAAPRPAPTGPAVLGFTGCDKASDSLTSLEDQIPVLLAAKSCHATYVNDKDVPAELSDERKSAISEHKRSLIFEKQSLKNKATKHMNAFDENIESLRLERHVLASDLKLAELQLLTMFQEYSLLLTFEDKDNALRNKQERCAKEKQEIKENISDLQGKYEAKLEDQAQWVSKQSNLMSDFRILVPENNPFHDILNKIYKKKIKRSKGTDDLDEEEDSEEEEDDDDDDYDDDEVEDVCPNGCDATLYDKVLDFREKRLDIEEVMTESQKVIDDFKKSLDRLKQREKQIDKEIKASESEMQSLQLSKQTALNKIEVCVPLNLSQLHTFCHSGILSGPAEEKDANESKEESTVSTEMLSDWTRRVMVEDMDITSHTLFTSSALERLSKRIGELKEEIVAAKVDLKRLHKEKVRLEKERGSQRANIESWTDKCNELQMLKFGRLIDLDVLEKGSDYSKIEEAEAAVSKVESEYQATMRKLQEEYDELSERLAKTTVANTQHLQRMGGLVEKKLTMTRELNLPKDSFAADPQLSDYKDSIERAKLSAFVKLQYREIDSLKSEITMLRRKETAQFAAFLPPAPSMQQSNSGVGGVTLPPIHNKNRVESKSANGGLRPHNNNNVDDVFGSQTSAL